MNHKTFFEIRKYYAISIINLALFFSNVNGQNLITSGITDGYDAIETSSQLSQKISNMFGNENIQTEYFQILGDLGEIKLDKGVIYSKLNFEERYVEGGLDLKVVRAFMGYENGKRRHYVGLGGNIGTMDINLEIDFKPGLLAITSATIGVPKKMLPAKLTIVNTGNDKVLFEHKWVFKDIPLANWVENKMEIPNVNAFVKEFVKRQYKGTVHGKIYSIKLNKSYVLLKQRPTCGIIIDASLEMDATQTASYQRVLFMVYQKRNQEKFSYNILDWEFSENLSSISELHKVYFHPSKVGDIVISHDTDGMRGSEILAYKFFKFEYRQNYNTIYFEPVILKKQYFTLSMAREKLDFSYSMEEEGIRINKKTYKKGYDNWILDETNNEFIDFYNELYFNQ